MVSSRTNTSTDSDNIQHQFENTKTMEKVNENVGFCGLYCPQCYKMRVSGTAKTLQFELERAIKKGARFTEELSPLFNNDLALLISKECHLFCRAGGGSKCKISICCREKSLEGCWLCPTFEKCDKLKEQFVNHCKDINRLGLDKYVETYK